METVNLAQIAQCAGVDRAAVVNWRHRHPDFPAGVAGTGGSPLFLAGAVEAWLTAHGKHPDGFTTPACRCGTPPDTVPALSPLAAADQAKRARDWEGEIGALTQGHQKLTTARWAPTRQGDRLTVTFEAQGDSPAFTETYEVVSSGDANWPEQNELRLVEHTAPSDDLAGWFAGSPEFSDGDAIETAWMEAGPDRLTLTRAGVVLHEGSHILPAPAEAEAEAGGTGGFFREGYIFSNQDGYTAPEDSWKFDCRHVTTTPTGERIAFGFVRVGADSKWAPTGLGRADWDRAPWTWATSDA
ncbi:hypothetical protein [Streptomyces sp. NPDC051561]|uniref:hypothetical protein n=1 Tax=Streptomyces sp. NPDC051561 TaxID=3365658 RepID=UPI0037AE5434